MGRCLRVVREAVETEEEAPVSTRRAQYGQSSHAGGYFPGIPASPGDEDLIESTTGWSGTRGAKVRQDAYGRLYVHDGDMEPADEADPSTIVARSAESSGYRGARPFFGADDRVRLKAGKFEYEGPQVGGIVLGLAGLYVAFRLLGSVSR